MGHLSTSERVDATKVCASSNQTQSSTQTNSNSNSNSNSNHTNDNDITIINDYKICNSKKSSSDLLIGSCPITNSNKDDNTTEPIYGLFSDTETFSTTSSSTSSSGKVLMMGEQNDQNNNNDVNIINKKIADNNNHNINNNNNNNGNINGNYIYLDNNKELEFTVDHRNKTDLNIYTTDFKGDSFLGIKFKAPLKWDKIIQITALHLMFIYGWATYDTDNHIYKTSLWSFFTGGIAGLGVTGGAHRLWTHRSYKANTILRSILMCCFSLAGQNTLFDWVRDHRVHHKYSETDADPHNSNRGFFFAHVGWLMMHKHPDVIKRGRQIDMSDVLSDPVVQFHQKYFIPLKVMLCFVIPTVIPVYFWNESWYYSFMQQCIFRYVFSLNFTWSVNSAAHMWGYRSYDKRINPSENRIVSIVAMGEGWHNYHHVFPWDYKAAELGNYKMNLTTMWIDIFAKLGWAWDMKQPSKELVKRTIAKYGDGTHPIYGDSNNDDHNHHHHIEEVPLPKECDISNLIIYNRKSD